MSDQPSGLDPRAVPGSRWVATRYHAAYGQHVDKGTLWRLDNVRSTIDDRIALVEYFFTEITPNSAGRGFVHVRSDPSSGIGDLFYPADQSPPSPSSAP